MTAAEWMEQNGLTPGCLVKVSSNPGVVNWWSAGMDYLVGETVIIHHEQSFLYDNHDSAICIADCRSPVGCWYLRPCCLEPISSTPKPPAQEYSPFPMLAEFLS